MNDLAVSPVLPAGAPQRPAASTEKMRETAQAFEASFLAQMLRPMFEGLSTEAPFGGGNAEATWRGFMIDEMAKQVVQAGGIGLSDRIMSEMLKMQEARP